jgi:hypothetical protein
MSQAIITKFLGPTNTRGARIKATCWHGSVIVPYDYSAFRPHRVAAQALCDDIKSSDRGAWHIIADAAAPNGTGSVFVIEWVEAE